MEIEIKQVTPWKRALDAARWTVHKDPSDKEPSDEWKKKILLAEHSPIRLVEYDIKLKDVPNKVVNHLVRHVIGIEKFVATHRCDRTNFKDEDVNRTTPTDVWFSVNAQALKNISYKRLCMCAEKETREVWQLIKDGMATIDPIMFDKMVPQCILHHGHCPELKPCGFCKTAKAQEMIKKYWNEK